MLRVVLSLVLLCGMVVAQEGQEPEVDTVKQSADLAKSINVPIVATMMGSSPYLSTIPVAFDNDGNPFVFVSDLSQHTTNFNEMAKKKELNASIFYHKKDDNDHATVRLTMQGKMVMVKDDGPEFKKLAKIYGKKFKDSKILFQFADFHFYKMEIDELFWYGGFAEADTPDVKKFKEQF